MIISESQGESTVDRLTAALEGRYRIEGELGAGGMANHSPVITVQLFTYTAPRMRIVE